MSKALLFLICFGLALPQAGADRKLTREEKQQIKDIRKELDKLDGSSGESLEKQAGEGNRLAAYFLGQQLQKEAMRYKKSPVFAENALAEAAFWLSAGARYDPYSRHSPINSRVDQAPKLPLRAVRSAPEAD